MTGVLIERIRDAGVELLWTGLPTAGNNVIEIDRGRLRRLIGQDKIVSTGCVLLLDVSKPRLSFRVVLQQLGCSLQCQRRRGRLRCGTGGEGQKAGDCSKLIHCVA